jgi:WD40 repeat protein
MIFDVNKARLDREIHGGSPRPLNRVHLCPHPTYGYLLLTGSAEGQAKLWDLRENNPHQKKYYKHSTAVTALAFSPDDPSSLVVGTENGTIKRYDLRMAPKPVGTLWGSHGNKAVMDLKWKGASAGDESGFMASAGGDKIVQVSRIVIGAVSVVETNDRCGTCLNNGTAILLHYTRSTLPYPHVASPGARTTPRNWPCYRSNKPSVGMEMPIASQWSRCGMFGDIMSSSTPCRLASRARAGPSTPSGVTMQWVS